MTPADLPEPEEPLPMGLMNRHARRLLEACARKGTMPRKQLKHAPSTPNDIKPHWK